jgi:regulator of sigma E protease
MSEILPSLLWFAVAIGVLITVHEFGHFWVARRMGVKVLRFSIGFGRPLFSWRRGQDQTEYVVAALPLGGYVKMLDETEGSVPAEEAHRAFNRQPVARRTAIVVAGPLFNFLFAVLAYWIMFMVGVTGVKPVVGAVTRASPASEAGLAEGDQILAVGGKRTGTWESVVLALLPDVMDRDVARIEVRGHDGHIRHLTLDFAAAALKADAGNLLREIGVRPWRPDIPPIIARVVPGGAAERAELRAGDRIVSVDGQPVRDWDEWVQYVRNHPGEVLRTVVERGGKEIGLEITPASMTTESGKVVGHIGAVVKLAPAMTAHGDYLATVRYGPVRGFVAGAEKTWDMTSLTVRLLGRMLLGEASWRNISGPISIAQYAGQAASIGVATFLAFLGLVSVSLGVLNILPIPVLDGGHLLYYLIEFFKGSPVSEQAQALGQRIGIALLLALMGVAFYNDLARFFE